MSNITITPQMGQEMRAGESVLPEAKGALAELEKARQAEAAARDRVNQVNAWQHEWDCLLAEIEELKKEIKEIEYSLPVFQEDAAKLRKYCLQKVGQQNHRTFAEQLNDLARLEQLLVLIPLALEKKRAALSSSLAEAVTFAKEHRIQAELPKAGPEKTK